MTRKRKLLHVRSRRAKTRKDIDVVLQVYTRRRNVVSFEMELRDFFVLRDMVYGVMRELATRN